VWGEEAKEGGSVHEERVEKVRNSVTEDIG
jgi:hypothetical protein